ncbi:MAG: TetR/AcrR family transcriptional regulator [Oceanospirillaceae bacterium]|nr:TetR/AcrR family transcriptional regulator [Oceanospirillaceae bacterium]
MPYTLEHKSQSRDRILTAAVDLFCRFGFDQISITRVMKQANMTHGAFYAHFKSKSELYALAIRHAAMQSLWVKEQHNISNIGHFTTLIDAYLSLAHVNQLGAPCPLAFLVTDVAHCNDAVRESYQQTFQAMLTSMSEQLTALGLTHSYSLAQQILTRLVGTVSIARTLADKDLQQSLLENSRRDLHQLLAPTAVLHK